MFRRPRTVEISGVSPVACLRIATALVLVCRCRCVYIVPPYLQVCLFTSTHLMISMQATPLMLGLSQLGKDQ